MKKRYLKKWVEVVLIMVILISLIVLGSESDKYFVISKIIAIILFIISGYILSKYSRIGGE